MSIQHNDQLWVLSHIHCAEARTHCRELDSTKVRLLSSGDNGIKEGGQETISLTMKYQLCKETHSDIRWIKKNNNSEKEVQSVAVGQVESKDCWSWGPRGSERDI